MLNASAARPVLPVAAAARWARELSVKRTPRDRGGRGVVALRAGRCAARARPRDDNVCHAYNFALLVRVSQLMQPGELLWTPGPERIRQANVTALSDWLARERGRRFADYAALWRWSVEDLEGFWQALWDYFGIESSAPHTRVLGRRGMPGAQWFPGAR